MAKIAYDFKVHVLPYHSVYKRHMMGQTRQVIDTDNFLPRFHVRIYVYTSEYIIHVYRSLKNNYTKSTSLVASIYFF